MSLTCAADKPHHTPPAFFMPNFYRFAFQFCWQVSQSKSIWNKKMYSRLLRCSTARGPAPKLGRGGPAMPRACKSILFIESSSLSFLFDKPVAFSLEGNQCLIYLQPK